MNDKPETIHRIFQISLTEQIDGYMRAAVLHLPMELSAIGPSKEVAMDEIARKLGNMLSASQSSPITMSCAHGPGSDDQTMQYVVASVLDENSQGMILLQGMTRLFRKKETKF